MENDLKGKDQGPPKKKLILKDLEAPDPTKVAKGSRPSRWDKQSSLSALNPMENQFVVGRDPLCLTLIGMFGLVIFLD